MRKNKMMRAASVLLVAVMLTTCAISGTFAKYTTTASGSDEARVAKWGVKITASGTTFAESYAKNDSATTYANTVVSAESGKKVLAPGTSGEMTKITISGKPEVAVKVTYSATLKLENWKYKGTDDTNEADYCPIVFKVNGVTYGTNDTDATKRSSSVSDLITAVQNAISAYSEDYGANTDFASRGNDGINVSWEWAFSSYNNQNDIKDTYLGNSEKAPTIKLDVSCTVTQID